MKTKIYSLNYSLAILVVFLIFSIGCKKEDSTILTGTVTDIDGNSYKTVKIGNQWWMAENLKVTRYRNGNSIRYITDNNQWVDLTIGACRDYENTPSNSNTYGMLYNWYAATDARNICPIGWHLPSDAEWTELISYLGGKDVAGGKLKETSTTHWSSPNTGATNETGFTALPGGASLVTGMFLYKGDIGWWWSATEVSTGSAWNMGMHSNNGAVARGYTNKPNGVSIRCVKD